MKNDFEKAMKKLEEIYYEKPDVTFIFMKNIIYSLESKDDHRISKKTLESKDARNVFKKSLIIFTLLLILIGLTSFKYNVNDFPIYYFGLVFFIAGLCVGLFVQGTGIIFLFSHGVVGICIILANQISYILKNPVVSDFGSNIYMWIGSTIILAIIGFILTIIYNVSFRLKNNVYFLYVLLGCFLISISIVQLFPLFYNFV